MILRIQQSFTDLSPIFPPKTTKYGLEKARVCPYRLPGVRSFTLITFQIPTPSLISKWKRSSEASPPDPVAPPKIKILFASTQAAPCAALADGGVPVAI